MATLSSDGKKILNNYDRFTGVPFNATIYDELPTGATVDNAIWFKNRAEFGGGYSKRDFDGPIISTWFGVTTGYDPETLTGPDITAALQQAIDSAIDSSIIMVPKGRYFFRNIVVKKGVTIDFDGSDIFVKPSDELGTGSPAIWIKGSLGNYYLINSVNNISSTIVTVNSDTTLMAGDYVRIEDSKYTPAWDNALSGTGTFGFYGRSEINQIKSIDGNSVILSKPVEWLYDSGSGAKITKVQTLYNPKVIGINSLVEIDPGIRGQDGAPVQPNLIQFDYCVSPVVEDVKIDGFNLQAIQFNHCISPNGYRINAKNAFRPQFGGHGYLIRFANCNNGVAQRCIGENIRHVIDFQQSYDCISELNLSTNPRNISFLTHGTGNKRCKSINDTVHTSTNADEAVIGWAIGNHSFSADYDTQIVSPTYIGANSAVVVGYTSERTRILTPNLKQIKTSGVANARLVTIVMGAKDTLVEGGRIDASQSTSESIFSRDTINPGDQYTLSCKNITIEGVDTIVSNQATNSINLINVLGEVNVGNNKIDGGNGLGYAISVTNNTDFDRLRIYRQKIRGNWKNGIFANRAPLKIYNITDNSADATFLLGFIDVQKNGILSLNNNIDLSNNHGNNINGTPGTNRELRWQSNGIDRFIARLTSNGETGGNVGSELAFLARADDGTAWFEIFRIFRDKGLMTFGSTFNGSHITLGSYHLWVDDLDRLHVKFGPPTNLYDGQTIGYGYGLTPVANTSDVVTTAFLNSTYPVAKFPVGHIVSYFNQGKEYRRESSTIWTVKNTALL